tara:strand:+ start:8212 stop:8631 length:420 start_codon:yes stop_codon:yes gene_type:complete
MAISPNKLVELFKNPSLSIKDQDLIKQVETGIDGDIIYDYGRKYNYNMDFVPDGFECKVYTVRYLSNVSFDSDTLAKAYLLNSYRKQGWSISLGTNWTWDMKFDRVELRNNTIDNILEDIENEEHDQAQIGNDSDSDYD